MYSPKNFMQIFLENFRHFSPHLTVPADVWDVVGLVVVPMLMD